MLYIWRETRLPKKLQASFCRLVRVLHLNAKDSQVGRAVLQHSTSPDQNLFTAKLDVAQSECKFLKLQGNSDTVVMHASLCHGPMALKQDSSVILKHLVWLSSCSTKIILLDYLA
jgi:hypothetical protein